MSPEEREALLALARSAIDAAYTLGRSDALNAPHVVLADYAAYGEAVSALMERIEAVS